MPRLACSSASRSPISRRCSTAWCGCKIKEEEARAAALFATLSLEGPAPLRARAISGAKAKIGRCARFVHQDAIQLHGAIGTTDELALGGYAKRLIAYESCSVQRASICAATAPSSPTRRSRPPGLLMA